MATCRPDYQPPLVLPLIGELAEEEIRSAEEIKVLSASESEGFSEVVIKWCYVFSTPFLLNEA